MNREKLCALLIGVFPTHEIEDVLGTIPILRQQKDWVGGSRKWPVLLKFSSVFMLRW